MVVKSAKKNSSSQAPSRSVGYQVKVLSQLNTRLFSAALEPYDLTPFHWLVLRCLWEENGVPVSTITARLQEVGGTMTGVLDRMESRGLVSRVRDPSDKRVYRVFLTKRGQELERELMPLIEKIRKQIYKGVAQKDLAAFQKIADRLIENCQSALGDDGK
jgi:DNA-binding MarR family transcriptional regulator